MGNGGTGCLVYRNACITLCLHACDKGVEIVCLQTIFNILFHFLDHIDLGFFIHRFQQHILKDEDDCQNPESEDHQILAQFPLQTSLPFQNDNLPL